MSGDDQQALQDAVAQIIASCGARAQQRVPTDIGEPRFDRALWQALEDSGMTAVGVAESMGGSGGSLAEAAAVVAACVREAAAVPVAEHMLVAAWALARYGRRLPESGPITPARARDVAVRADGGTMVLDGTVPGVRWAPEAAYLALIVGSEPAGRLCLVPRESCSVRTGVDLSQRSLGDIELRGVAIPNADVLALPPGAVEEIEDRVTLSRAVEISAALSQIVDWTLSYAAERSQFGRALNQFQSVQADIARMVGEAASAAAAVDLALGADGAGPASTRAAVALARAVGAATVVTRAAHQIHGAIGFTREHRLHLLTTLVWSLRSGPSSERVLSAELGAALSAGDLWPNVVALSGRDGTS